MPRRSQPLQLALDEPTGRTVDALRSEAAGCTRCDLYRDATQTVFGAGDGDARVVFVGEQPGDQEDKEGAPFVGPAGRVLDDALDEVGVDRAGLYVTNAVKHFKFERRGKARIHKKPSATEITACHVWLAAELDVVQPDVVVALGASAARAILGHPVKIGDVRGEVLDVDGLPVVVTVHPSAVLRARGADDRQRMFDGLCHDLRVVQDLLGPTRPRTGS